MMNYSRSMKRKIKRRLMTFLVIVGLAVLVTGVIKAVTADDKKIQVIETVAPNIEPMYLSTAEPLKQSVPEIISLGEFKLTAYCPCSKCCDKWGENRPVDKNGKQIVYTANQSIAQEGITIAADISVLPYNTRVIIDGHEYIVQDRGGAIKGNRIDIYFESHQEALNFGVQYKEIFIERMNEND